MSSNEETRRTGRVAVKIPVKVRVNPSSEKDFRIAQRELYLSAIEVSVTGMGILSNVYVPEGVILDIEFDTKSLFEKEKENRQVKITGEVVSSRMYGGQYRLGILFKEISPDDKSTIRKFTGAV